MQALQLSKIPYRSLPKNVPPSIANPDPVGDPYSWPLPPDLDVFFRHLYKFWYRKGFLPNLLHELFNLVGLLFIILFSSFLLFCIDWTALRSDCNRQEENCDIARRLIRNPFEDFQWTSGSMLKFIYVGFFFLYWMGTVAVATNELRNAREIHRFCRLKLGISEEQMPWISWSELIHRLVLIQRTMRLCLQRDLNACDIVNRILRKENYLVGMIDKGILQLTVPLPGFKKRPVMTKMMEWSLRWGLLTPMFDHDFQIRNVYRSDPEFLSGRFRTLAVVHMVLAPFLLVFVGVYLLMMYVERFYHAPSTFIERSWSPHARWRLRHFNEMEHQLDSRLSLSHRPAQDYVDQFPNDVSRHVGKLLSFILGSFVALLLFAALLQDGLLEADLMQHNLVWWAAVLMIGLKLARGLAPERAVLDPDACLREVVRQTHFYPRLWRGRARSREVQECFGNMFRYRPLNIVDEVLSIFMTPYLLYFSLPNCSGRIVQFLQNYTVRIVGVGDVCSLSTFDFQKHGNKKYAASEEGNKSDRSRQGKMEKSFLSFVDFYPEWEPSSSGRRLLRNLEPFLIASVRQPSIVETDGDDALRRCSDSQGTSRVVCDRPNCSQSHSSHSSKMKGHDEMGRSATGLREQGSHGNDLHRALESFYLFNGSRDSEEHRLRCDLDD